MDNLHAVIMAGGSGKRFWPASRRKTPKQVLAIAGPASLIRMTIDRISGLVPASRIYIVTGREQEEVIRREAADLPAGNVIVEPEGRDTAACIGLAATALRAVDPGAVMAVLSADHVVEPASAFRDAIAAAAEIVRARDALVTFGVRPTRPATGYGYIRRGAEEARIEGVPFARVAEFKEKPDLATARRYCESGDYLWNSGVFVWRAGKILDEIARHVPALAAGLGTIAEAWPTARRAETLARLFPTLPRTSIDYAVMEKSRDCLVAEVGYAWDDVGSWDAVARHLPRDAAGNAARGAVVALGATGNCVLAPEGHTVALLGVNDLCVVVTPDATLVCPRDRAEEVKALVERLEKEGRSSLL